MENGTTFADCILLLFASGCYTKYVVGMPIRVVTE